MVIVSGLSVGVCVQLTISVDDGNHLSAFLLVNGLASTGPTCTPPIDLNKKIALERLLNRSRAPVRNPLPILKFRKEKHLCALRRQRVWKWTRNAGCHQLSRSRDLLIGSSPRIHSRLSSPISSHNFPRPSTISCQCSRTSFSGTSAGNRCAMRLYIALRSASSFELDAGSGVGISRISLEPFMSYRIHRKDSRISPMLGPPKHRRISAELPPSSETGRTNAGDGPKADANELAPVPPDITRYERSVRLVIVGYVL